MARVIHMKQLVLVTILGVLLWHWLPVVTQNSTFSVVPEDVCVTVGRSTRRASFSCASNATNALVIIFLVNGSHADLNVTKSSSLNVALTVEASVPNTETIIVCRAIFSDANITEDQLCNDTSHCVDSDPAKLTTKFGVRDVTLGNNETGQLCITCHFGDLEGTNISGCAGNVVEVATSITARNFTIEIDRGNVDNASTCVEVDVSESGPYCVMVYDLYADGSRSEEPAEKRNVTLNREGGKSNQLLPLYIILSIAFVIIIIIVVVCVVVYKVWKHYVAT